MYRGLSPSIAGHDGVRRWWADFQLLREEWRSIEGRFEGVSDVDDTVVAPRRAPRGRGKEQRGEGSDACAYGRHLPGRQARATAGVPDPAEALEAVGLSE